MTDWHNNGTQEDTRMTDQPVVTKEEWIAALRSGKYKQGIGSLYRPKTDLTKSKEFRGAFCCLGVLCKLAGYEEQENSRLVPHMDLKEDVRDGYIPNKLAKALNLDRHTQTYLASLNDGGTSFSEIADYLESLP